MNLLTLLLTTALTLTQHGTMPPGMSHDEHLKQMEKDEALKKRGAVAMGFDQDAAEHHFIIEPGGGTIQVTIKPGSSRAVLGEVRDHLKMIATEFSHGDFTKPFQTHNEVPPGVEGMKKMANAIAYRYQDVENGGAVHMTTASAEATNALHAFLRYQITEHHTGDALQLKR